MATKFIRCKSFPIQSRMNEVATTGSVKLSAAVFSHEGLAEVMMQAMDS
jgi:hypothetical protein